MNYDEFFNYQISDTSPLDFADWLDSEFQRSCPKELVTETRKLELDSGIVEPDETDLSYHFCITGFAFYGKSRAGEDKKDEGMKRPTGKKDLRVIPPEISDRSLVDIEIRTIDENSIQVICTWNNNHRKLIEFLKNLKEQIRLNYNLVKLSNISWSNLQHPNDLSEVQDVLFEFIFRENSETFLDWCHIELAIMYPGDFYDSDDYYGPGIVARPSGVIVPPDKGKSVWRYLVIAGNQHEDGRLSISDFIAAYIEARPIENNQSLVRCLYDFTISPVMKDWLAKLEERAKLLSDSPIEQTQPSPQPIVSAVKDQQTKDNAKRKRGPSADILKYCEEGLKNWLDKNMPKKTAADLAGIDPKTMERWIPNVLELVDLKTQERWIKR